MADKAEQTLQVIPASGEEISDRADWRQLLSAFLRDTDVKPTSKRQYEKALTLFFQWIEDSCLNLRTLTRADILAYKEELLRRRYLMNRKKNLTAMTITSYMVAVRRFFVWTESTMQYPNIAKGVKSPKVMKGHSKHALEAKQCQELLGALTDDVGNKLRKIRYNNGHDQALRDYAIIELILRTGLRTIEVARLDVGDIRSEYGIMVMDVWGKGRDTKDDYVPLSDKAYEAIEAYLKTRPEAQPSDPLFICEGYGSRGRRISTRRIQAICKNALREIGLDEHAYSAHSLRHTCAVRMIEKGASAYDVQKLLRHSSINTTEIYLKDIEKKMRLKQNVCNLLDEVF